MSEQKFNSISRLLTWKMIVVISIVLSVLYVFIFQAMFDAWGDKTTPTQSTEATNSSDNHETNAVNSLTQLRGWSKIYRINLPQAGRMRFPGAFEITLSVTEDGTVEATDFVFRTDFDSDDQMQVGALRRELFELNQTVIINYLNEQTPLVARLLRQYLEDQLGHTFTIQEA